MRFSRLFYKMARMMNDFEALSSGNPSRIARRGVNKLIGRTIVKNMYLKGSGGRKGRKRMF